MSLTTKAVAAGMLVAGLFSGPLGDVAGAAPVVMVAGDIACPPGQTTTAVACRHRATSRLLVRRSPDRVLTSGDNQYERGRLRAFRRSYDETWGRVKRITRPTPGNHDYGVPRARGYFEYFGRRAGRIGRGYYSFDVGRWHLIALNSEVSTARSSRQVEWLRKDLETNPARCTLAYWHSPLFSSGTHGNDTTVRPLWRRLFRAGADIVVNGHDHDYERFAPLEPDGDRNRLRGIAELVVGTGGVGLRPFDTIKRHSRARNSNTFGVLKLTLRPKSYEWRFIPEQGGPYSDRGSRACH